MTHITPNLVQTHYRIRSGDTVGLNVDSGWAAGLSLGASINVDIVFRVRIEIEENAGGPATPGGQLEANLNGGAFQNVTTSSTIVRAVASGQFDEGAATTNILAGSGLGFIAGVGSEDGLAAAPSLTNQHTELEYAVQIMSADVANNDLIVMRVAGMNSYTNQAAITVIEAPPATPGLLPRRRRPAHRFLTIR